MGSLNSASPTHFDNGIVYRKLSAKWRQLLELNRPYLHLEKAQNAHDFILAKLAYIEAVYLTMTPNTMPASKNQIARDWSKTAVNLARFNRYFDSLITEVR